MKKFFTLAIGVALAGAALAQHGHRPYNPPPRVIIHERNGDILVPLIIGGVLGAVIANQHQHPAPQQVPQQHPQPVYVPPVYQPAPVVTQQRMPTIQCPAGTTDYWTRETDRMGNPYFLFAGCR